MYNTIIGAVAPAHQEHAREILDKARESLNPGGRILLVSVVEPPPLYVASELPQDLFDTAVKRTREELENMVSEAGDGATPEIRVLTGHGSSILLAEAKEQEADLVIVFSHQPGIQDFFLGSTAGRLVRHAHCSVLVMR